MILDFDLSEGYPAGAVGPAGFYRRASGYPAGAVGASPGGDAFLFFILFMQHTQYTLLFFVHIAKSHFFQKIS